MTIERTALRTCALKSKEPIKAITYWLALWQPESQLILPINMTLDRGAGRDLH